MVTLEIGSEKFQARATGTSGALRQRLFDAQAKLLPVLPRATISRGFTDYDSR